MPTSVPFINTLRQPLLRRTALLLALACLPAWLAGCGQRAQKQITEAESSYNEGRYEEAYQQAVAAEKVARESGQKGKNPQVASAAYLAGLSAYRLDRLDEAQRQLDVAIEAGEGEAAGRAYAQRGAVFLRQGRFMAASVDYDQAALLLGGEDAAKAKEQSAAARRAAGDSSSGSTVVLGGGGGLSVSASTTPGGSSARPGASAPALPSVRTSWTLQVACFRDRAAAERQAKALAGAAQAHGLAAPRLLSEENPTLGPVYCVVIGEFATKAGAEQARERLGRKDYFIRTMRGT
jgi:tetratricopeptide (TPR) repeat protein